MQSPVSMQVDAQRRDAAGPSPVRRMSMTPAMTSCAGAVTPAGVLTGHTSTHLPQRVHVSIISSTRPFSASSKKLLMGARVTIPLVDGTQVYALRCIEKRECSGRCCAPGMTLARLNCYNRTLEQLGDAHAYA